MKYAQERVGVFYISCLLIYVNTTIYVNMLITIIIHQFLRLCPKVFKAINKC